MKEYSLYLDDERVPKTQSPYGDWVVCRSYIDSMNFIKSNGHPSYMSLDHDLGESKSGHNFISDLVFYDESINNKLFNGLYGINVHSANPIGRENIYGVISSYMKHYNLKFKV